MRAAVNAPRRPLRTILDAPSAFYSAPPRPSFFAPRRPRPRASACARDEFSTLECVSRIHAGLLPIHHGPLRSCRYYISVMEIWEVATWADRSMVGRPSHEIC